MKDITNAGLGDSPYRRARAGTVPSSFGASPGGSTDPRTSPGSHQFSPSTFRSGTSSPYKEKDTLGALPALRISDSSSPSSRLRAGSLTLPQSRNAYSSAFGPSIFSTSWAQRINSQIPSSPAQSTFSRDDEQTPIKTLDYLGLAETPTPPRNMLAMMNMNPQAAGATSSFSPEVSGLRRDANRIRSYSVNSKEHYNNEHDFDDSEYNDGLPANAANYGYADLYRQSPSRPRSRTAGILDSPPSQRSNKYTPMHSHMESTITAADIENYARDDQYPSNDRPIRPEHHNTESPYEESSLMSGYVQSQPTRALWLGNIPSSTPSAALLAMFSSFGPIESARVLTHKSCAFVNFEMLESAVVARSACNGKELFPGAGPVRIGFAKAPSALSSSTPEPYTFLDTPSVNTGEEHAQATSPPSVASMRKELVSLSLEFGATEEDMNSINSLLDRSIEMSTQYKDVPIMPEPTTARRYDAPKLRDIRKKIDNGGWSQDEIEEIALDLLDEVAELASDYLGNTVVQKLFEFCSEPIRMKMLEQISPVLAEIGVHKNGTWAAQKIIDTASTPQEMTKIIDALRPCVPALFLDQFGNYVIQCCLKFGPTFNSFIFEAMLSHTWEIAQGRYGARAMRACLESHHTSKAQQRLQAAVVTVHSVQLATNANSALLLTWLLDTCMLPNRYRLLAPKLSQHLVHLCNPKLASLTVLKVINQRQEPEARDFIIEGIFFSEGDQVLEGILSNQAHGPTLIFKIITTPYVEGELRSRIITNVRNVVQRLKLQPVSGSKRLMDEVGLSSRGLNTQDSMKRGYTPQYAASHYGMQNDAGSSLPRSATASIDPATLQALGEMSISSNPHLYAQNGNPQLQQIQYQAMLQQNMRVQQQQQQHHHHHQQQQQNQQQQHQQQQQQHQQQPYGYTTQAPYNDPYMGHSMYGNNVYCPNFSPQFSSSTVQRRR